MKFAKKYLTNWLFIATDFNGLLFWQGATAFHAFIHSFEFGELFGLGEAGATFVVTNT